MPLRQTSVTPLTRVEDLADDCELEPGEARANWVRVESTRGRTFSGTMDGHLNLAEGWAARCWHP
jgi:hypothetical protein